MATGGSIESIAFEGRSFSVPADADAGRKLGGSENDVQANGDETARLIKTRVAWGLADLTIAIDDDTGDAEFLQELADRNGFFSVTITFASGNIYQGTGQLTGEMPTASQATTAAINLMGQGRLTKQ
ncbi:MAG: hypothetical protein V3W41_14465 [Planctomycetota bacterium]